jgi:hypothetical protein
VFSFYIESTWKNISELEKIFYFGLLTNFEAIFFVFLKVLIGLTRFQRCFLNVLGQKTSLKWILEWQKQELCFYSHHNDSNMRNYRWHIVFFFFCQNIRWIIKFQIVILRLLKKNITSNTCTEANYFRSTYLRSIKHRLLLRP